MKLRCVRGPLKNKSFPLGEDSRALLGREPGEDGALPILLDSRTVSRKHAEIFYDGSHWLVKDLKSFNGLRVNKNKVLEAYLKPGDVIELGEYSFIFEGGGAVESTEKIALQMAEKFSVLSVQGQEKIKNLRSRWDRLDFSWKIFAVAGLFAVIVHFIVSWPLHQEAYKQLSKENFKSGRLFVEQMAEKYKQELAEEKFVLIDCDSFRLRFPGVKSILIFGPKGDLVCPIGDTFERDALVDSATQNLSFVSDCRATKMSDCAMMSPVFYQKVDDPKKELVGFARVQFEPTDLEEASSQMSALRFQMFFLALFFAFLFALFFRRSIRSALELMTEQVRLLFTGTAQKVEKLENFADLSPLIDEINKLNTKSNHGVKHASGGGDTGASFLQSFLQQVFLLEERALLAVNSDNQILAVTPAIFGAIPLSEDSVNRHITEAVADTHLQGELMGFLNELSGSGELLEKPLTLSDRVVHARGLPIILNGEHVGTVIQF